MPRASTCSPTSTSACGKDAYFAAPPPRTAPPKQASGQQHLPPHPTTTLCTLVVNPSFTRGGESSFMHSRSHHRVSVVTSPSCRRESSSTPSQAKPAAVTLSCAK
eukprot:TRINITY_DN5601_c0_g1_i4.p1 TRINITY_DN5601_c0_g1~~TRINITY_DN5601_c0_g1_i4.p1  ORF type:complete len:105 (+),score=6.88 TRINITY_DN5601_c0_g1_i4:170-484(+)